MPLGAAYSAPQPRETAKSKKSNKAIRGERVVTEEMVDAA